MQVLRSVRQVLALVPSDRRVVAMLEHIAADTVDDALNCNDRRIASKTNSLERLTKSLGKALMKNDVNGTVRSAGHSRQPSASEFHVLPAPTDTVSSLLDFSNVFQLAYNMEVRNWFITHIQFP
jgi:hypothetical protein